MIQIALAALLSSGNDIGLNNTLSAYVNYIYMYIYITVCKVYIHVVHVSICTVCIHVVHVFLCTVYIHVVHISLCTVCIFNRLLNMHISVINYWYLHLLYIMVKKIKFLFASVIIGSLSFQPSAPFPIPCSVCHQLRFHSF